MFCLVDFRNRPQYQYTFSKIEKAREALKRLQNNPLGVTVVFPDGRREYFEKGLPSRMAEQENFYPETVKGQTPCKNSFQILKGCHVKYRICELKNLDGVVKKNAKQKSASVVNWQRKSTFPFFLLGNRKIYTGLALASLLIFFSSFYFQNQNEKNSSALAKNLENSFEGIVAGASDEKISEQNNLDESFRLADEEIVMNLLGKIEEARTEEFETEILRYVKGRPMENMTPYIAKQPRIVAAFLVGIAMKESKFGTYSPKLGGRDCHNYWGFKGGGTTTAGGYTCFGTPEEAVKIVGKRIARLVDSGRTNPSSMVIWKCGRTCSWDNPENVRKWIADVGINFYKINSKESS